MRHLIGLIRGWGGKDSPPDQFRDHRAYGVSERIWAQVNGAKLAGVNANLLMFDRG